MKRLPIALALLAASLIMAGRPGLHLASFAWHTGEQSYILVIPAMALGLIYLDRQRIFASLSAGLDRRAMFAFVAAAVLIAASYLLPASSEAQLASVGFGLAAFWIGAFIFCFGAPAARAAMFPLGLLVCMVPIPAFCIDAVTVALQKGSAEMVDWLFRVTGVPYFRDNFNFQLAGQGIVVARECSGIRSSLSLIILTLAIAHESLRSTANRFVLIASTIPIVILKNGIRIVTLTLLAVYVDPSFLYGSLHHDGGILFFLIGLVMLLPILRLLRRSEIRKAVPPPPEIAESASGAHA